MAEFSIFLEEHIFELHTKLITGIYTHSPYSAFYICDPKRRHIHKAQVADCLLHHAIFRILEPIFDTQYIYDSYSSRKHKGIHCAHERFYDFAWKLSRNNTRTVWILKCDIKKFFDSVDHRILINIISKTIKDEKTIMLLEQIIQSFSITEGKGIPLGNLTSQLFSNIYLNIFDQYIKRKLRVKYYIRYADDFVVMDTDKGKLMELIELIKSFLWKELTLTLHPNKICIRKFSQGIDFLGYVIFPYHQILKTKTKRRMLSAIVLQKELLSSGKISSPQFNQILASYLGLLKHCCGQTIRKDIEALVKCN